MTTVPEFSFLWESVRYWSRREPTRPALTYRGATIDYGELDAGSEHTARALLARDIARGDRIATILPPRPEFVQLFLAASRIGAITVPLDVRFRPADLRRYLLAAEPKLLISVPTFGDHDIDASLATLGDALPHVDRVAIDPDGLTNLSEALGVVPVDRSTVEGRTRDVEADDGCLIVFTGGTTGRPKAALLSQRNVATMVAIEANAFVRWSAALGGDAQGTMLANLPPSHVGGSVELIGAPLAAGWNVFLQERWSPSVVLETIERERMTMIGAVPTMYAILLAQPDLERFDLSSLRLALLSGERVSLELLRGIRDRLCSHIVVGYGSTEAGPEVTFTELDDRLEDLANGYVGRPLPGVEIDVVDDENRSVPRGETGEVLIRSPMTIQHYFRMPEEDEAGFTAEGFCRTGDLGHLDSHGGLYIDGRKKHVIRVGSYTVVPSEVEEVAMTHPGVAAAAAVGAPHPISGEVVWLYIAAVPNTTVGADELVTWCARDLADFKVPKRVIIREQLPTSRIGKVDRQVLQQEVVRQHSPS